MAERAKAETAPRGRGGRGGERARGAAENGEGSAEQPPSRLSRALLQEAFECGTCGDKDTARQMQNTTVPSCVLCFERYSQGSAQFGDLETVQEGVQDEDSHIHDCWEEAKRTEQAGGRGQFFPTTVDEGQQCIVSVVKPMAGLTRAQLISDVLQEEPEKLGIKLRDLPDHEGATY